ncbi:MAG: endonuclease/exonuclease/phosphatase family protein, partial [Bacteroidota bacterium]
MPIPGEFNLNEGVFGGRDTTERASAIAAQIKASDTDVVVLNEVFSEEAREVFIEQLADQGDYDSYVSLLRGPALKKLDMDELNGMLGGAIADAGWVPPVPGGVIPLAQSANSGLMIFSKYPFLKFDAADDPPMEAYEAEVKNLGLPMPASDFVAFKLFEQCGDFDCFASKGVGMVRIAGSPHNYNVAFTHMQADASGVDGQAVRASQMGTIRELIEGSLTPDQRTEEWVIVAGDVNVTGQGAEWDKLFDPSVSPGGFYACGDDVVCPYDESTESGSLLADLWGFETSPTDPGLTSSDGKRLDYILAN